MDNSRVVFHSRFGWLPWAVVVAGAAQLFAVFALPELIDSLDPLNGTDGSSVIAFFVFVPIFTLAIFVLAIMALVVSRWPIKIVAGLIFAAPFVEVAVFFRALSDMVVP